MPSSVANGSSPATPLRRQSAHTLERALAYLVRHQARDGLWRDYSIKEVMSEGWTTAWVGWCLTSWAGRPEVDRSLALAARALLEIGRPEGWGYNRKSVADADSTSWVIAFLSASGYRCRDVAIATLSKFVSPAGSVRTFLNPTTGTWSNPHSDVAAVLALALGTARALPEMQERIRRALLRKVRPDGSWQSFWWSSDLYATAWAAICLNRTGSLSAAHASRLVVWLESIDAPSPLECALALLLLVELRAEPCRCAQLAMDLMDRQLPGGAWPPSPFLLIPPRRPEDQAYPCGPHADVNGFLSTSLAALAIKSWAVKCPGMSH